MNTKARKRILISLVLFACTILLLSISTPCFAQNELKNDVDEQGIEMLDATDVGSAITQMKQDYYEPLDEMTLLNSFVEGVKKYSVDNKKENPLKDFVMGGNFTESLDLMNNCFRKSGMEQRKWQLYIQAGLKFMVDSLNNPGCEYSPPGKYRVTLQEMGYNKGGCGFFVDEKLRDSHNRWIIIDTLQDFPAEKEGIKSGDRLISVNGKDVRELSFKELATVVRGPIGSEVKLVVYRPSKKKELEILIKRTWLGPNPKSLRTAILKDNIGYIKFRFLGERMDSTIEDVYKDFENKKVKAVIWDFRNSAGMMEGATDLASYYAPEDKVFALRVFLDSTSGFEGKTPHFTCKPDVILMNKYTSAPAAFLALVLREYYKIPIVGRPMKWEDDDTKSFRLRDDSHIKFPYSYYKLENETILKNGVVVKPDTDVGQHPLPPYDEGDRQMNKALEMINEKK